MLRLACGETCVQPFVQPHPTTTLYIPNVLTSTTQPTPAALAGREGRYKWAPDGPDGAAADLGPGEAFDAAAIRAARAAAAEASGPAPGSSRTMKADVEGMLAGCLGKKVPYTGKACVMELLTPAGAGYAKFSKCVGWMECDDGRVCGVGGHGG